MTAWLMRANLLLAMTYAVLAFAVVVRPHPSEAKRVGPLMLAPSVAVLTYFLLGASASGLTGKIVATALVHVALIASAIVHHTAQTDERRVRWGYARYAIIAMMASGLLLAAWGGVIPA